MSIGKFKKGNVDIEAISGHRHLGNIIISCRQYAQFIILGGEDFDNEIVNDFIRDLENKHNVNFVTDKNHLRKLRNLCREAKENMAGTEAAQSIEVRTAHS